VPPRSPAVTCKTEDQLLQQLTRPQKTQVNNVSIDVKTVSCLVYKCETESVLLIKQKMNFVSDDLMITELNIALK